MLASDIVRLSVWEDCDVVEMARITVDGTAITPSDLAGITFYVYDETAGEAITAVAESLTIASVVTSSLTTGNGWTVDGTGYNFRHRVAGTYFATSDHVYRVEYLFTGSAGEKFAAVYEHPVQPLRQS